ncbi:MAG: sulfatase-like hydrolase/transferase, partial [Bacteroidaceae bacterium]|nr:sulfatase-like hydrolase/transferase [Bacteroidaceae bacterium]
MNNKLLLGLAPLGAMAAFAQQRPNIIYIMCDDMGYGDLGCYGQQYIATPNIDRMAAQGMRFTQAYAGSPVSAPSRACFMTGQHSGHGHVRGNREYWNGKLNYKFTGANGNVCTDYSVVGQEPYDKDHVIIPEIFKAEGYATGMFGKWAGGYYDLNDPSKSSHSTPDKRGIDCFYGPICQFQAHTYYPNFLNRYDPKNQGATHADTAVNDRNILRTTVVSKDPDFENREQYSADLIHQYALRWLDERAEEQQENGKPFLGIFTYTLPHAELWQPRDSILAAYDQHFCQEKSFGGQSGNWYYKNNNAHAQFAA